jgi:23S rRNA pseudouridine1911/1915/1917 synthase
VPHLRVPVEPGAAGQRVDQLLCRALPGLSAAGARRLLATGAVRVDGRPARKGDRLTAGQVLEVDERGPATETPEGRRVQPDPALELQVLALDDSFVAVDKPPGWPSHPLAAGERGTVANALVARFPECAAASPDPREGGLVQRLDTETSGVLLAARSSRAWTALRQALSEPGCEKVYLAEVAGAAAAGQSSEPIGRVGRRGARVRVGAGRNPLPAQTTWEVLAHRATTTLLRVRLGKGRAHQVRAHLSAAGHAIVGDRLYGAGAGDERLHLHAWSIRFRHPGSGATISIEAPPPAWAKMAP